MFTKKEAMSLFERGSTVSNISLKSPNNKKPTSTLEVILGIRPYKNNFAELFFAELIFRGKILKIFTASGRKVNKNLWFSNDFREYKKRLVK